MENTSTETDNCTVNRTCTVNTNTSNIRIKLKFINDDLKLVEGRLEEPLGEFKR